MCICYYYLDEAMGKPGARGAGVFGDTDPAEVLRAGHLYQYRGRNLWNPGFLAGLRSGYWRIRTKGKAASGTVEHDCGCVHLSAAGGDQRQFR